MQGLALIAAISLLAACGGSDDTSTSAPEPASDASEPAAEPETDAVEPASESEPAEAPSGGDVNATLTLDSGETFEFFVRCSIEPQIAAGSEILFTATSFEAPSIDITQFGNEGPVTDIASVTVSDASYETLWEASSFYEAFGGTLELSLDGSTINGTGTFFAGGDPGSTPVNGTVVANC